MKLKFYRCNVCGNVVVKIEDSGVVMHCCGREMEEMVPKRDEEGNEKHVPSVTFPSECEVNVKVGVAPHPMVKEHFIQWVFLETDKGWQLERLNPSEKPEVIFHCQGQRPCRVYELCNVHGFWGVNVKDGFSENYYC